MRLVRAYKSILFITAFLIILGLLIRCHIRSVPVVIGGPIDTNLTSVGPINKGMTRAEVIEILGPPLRPRDPTGSPWTDYFSGVYASVGWTQDDKVASVGFAFDTFESNYSTDFRVVLRYSNRNIVLSRKLNWTDAQRLWNSKETATSSPNVVKGDHVIQLVFSGAEYVSLYFSTEDGKLQNAGYSFR